MITLHAKREECTIEGSMCSFDEHNSLLDRFGDIMARTPNIDTEKLKAQSLQLRDAAAVHAGRIAVRAADLAEQGLDWAAPRAQAALASAIERTRNSPR